MKKLFTLLLVGLAVSFASQHAVAAEYAVVVNAKNNFSGDATIEIKNLFLKKKTAWDNGIAAHPFARSGDSPEQVAFSSKILGMSASEAAGYWQSEKQKTGATPPKAVGSEGILFRQIDRKEGAFGVVLSSSAVALPEGLKILFKFTD
jgi:hypothetical protein